jgi:hypothetical protein
VREAGQVADERADRAPTAPPRRERVAWRLAAANLSRDLGGQLEHLPVQEEEPGETELANQGQLFVEPRAGPAVMAGGKAACPRERTRGGGLGEPGGSPS